MTSSDTSSPSLTTRSQVRETLSKLLSEPKKLHSVALVLRSQGWEEISELLLAERLEHLELAVDLEESSEQRDAHAIVARWIKHFCETVVETIHEDDQRSREPKIDPATLVADSMPIDSDGAAEEVIN